MRRSIHLIVRLLVLALFCVQASGVAGLLTEDDCRAECEGEDEDGDCPDDCSACVCCADMPALGAPPRPAFASPLSQSTGQTHPTGDPSMAEPQGIEHVPKASFA